MNELLKDMDELGGGINVKLSAQETIAILPQDHEFLREGRSSQLHNKDSKFIISRYGKEKEQKEFKFKEIVSTTSSFQSYLLHERNFSDWFFQGFNLSILFFTSPQKTFFDTAINIIEKYSKFMDLIRISCVKLTPRSSDTFQTEDMDDLFGVHNNVTKIDEAEQLQPQIAVKYLMTLASKEQLNSKQGNLSSTIIRFKYQKSQGQASELNLVQIFDEIFSQPNYTPNLFKYQTMFEKGFLGAISEIKSTQFLSNKDPLSRASLTKTRLLDYLSSVVFSTTKSIISIDLSRVKDGNSAIKLLKTVNDFNSYNTVCHRFSSNQSQPIDPTYNPTTRRFKGNDQYESLEDMQEKSTQRKGNNKRTSSSLGKALPETTPFTESSTKYSFKEEMKSLLDRIQAKPTEPTTLHKGKQSFNIQPQSAIGLNQKIDKNQRQVGDYLNQSFTQCKTEGGSSTSRNYASKKNTFLIEESYKNQIEELKEEQQLNNCNYEIEINQQRETIKNLQRKLVLLAEEKQLSDLIRLYESELYRYSESQKVLRAQIGYLSENKVEQKTQEELGKSKVTTSNESRKLKDIIASLNLEINDSEQEINALKRKFREQQLYKLQEQRYSQRIIDLEQQRDQLVCKNTELVTSLNNIGGIVSDLKKENSLLSHQVNSHNHRISELEEDNQTLQTLVELSSKQRQPKHKLQTQKVNENTKETLNGRDLDTLSSVSTIINTLKNLVLKTGSGIPESLLAQFSENIHSEFEKINIHLEQYKKKHRGVEEFLLNIIVSLEIWFQETYGKNEKNVRDLNKFIRDFLFESII